MTELAMSIGLDERASCQICHDKMLSITFIGEISNYILKLPL
jgi:hypothetical protein